MRNFLTYPYWYYTYYLPLQIMGPLVDLTQSRTLENLRLRYGKYFNLVLFRQYLDFTGHGDNKGVVVRVKDIERASGMVFLTIYHHSQKKDNIPSFLTTALHTYYQVPKNQIHVTTIDPHHFKIVFPSSS
ncbi:MAG: hypothetical protein UX62_C0003G0004 [Microgenomates group bacterium GW2011_GWA2_46_7]|nr:MAG: hypothetical protein UX62_C0003G0004 [Microgenomates group bacterium GW2011_GWA2_46_7]